MKRKSGRLRTSGEIASSSKSNHSELQKKQKLSKQKFRSKKLRNERKNEKNWLYCAAFNYKQEIEYSEIPEIYIGLMIIMCVHCKALRYEKEAPGICCLSGKINLPPIQNPPEFLIRYTSGDTKESINFLKNIRKYNSCFQMTSFGATKIVNNDNYLPTFKIQGQIYHTIGSLLPQNQSDSKFLQIYFMGDESSELIQRCDNNFNLNESIVLQLQQFLHVNNNLVKTFKYAIENMPSNDFKLIIKADKAPNGMHKKRFNEPTQNEVAIIMVNDECDSRDIILRKRDTTLQRVRETHRSYDALQYPILFPYGTDGYHFNLMQTDPKQNVFTNKKVMI